jgi:hypothetical protein
MPLQASLIFVSKAGTNHLTPGLTRKYQASQKMPLIKGLAYFVLSLVIKKNVYNIVDQA